MVEHGDRINNQGYKFFKLKDKIHELWPTLTTHFSRCYKCHLCAGYDMKTRLLVSSPLPLALIDGLSFFKSDRFL